MMLITGWWFQSMINIVKAITGTTSFDLRIWDGATKYHLVI